MRAKLVAIAAAACMSSLPPSLPNPENCPFSLFPGLDTPVPSSPDPRSSFLFFETSPPLHPS